MSPMASKEQGQNPDDAGDRWHEVTAWFTEVELAHIQEMADMYGISFQQQMDRYVQHGLAKDEQVFRLKKVVRRRETLKKRLRHHRQRGYGRGRLG